MYTKRYFKILISPSPEELSILVDQEIKKGLGWVPSGSMIMTNDYGVQWRQPMIRTFNKRRMIVKEEA